MCRSSRMVLDPFGLQVSLNDCVPGISCLRRPGGTGEGDPRLAGLAVGDVHTVVREDVVRRRSCSATRLRLAGEVGRRDVEVDRHGTARDVVRVRAAHEPGRRRGGEDPFEVRVAPCRRGLRGEDGDAQRHGAGEGGQPPARLSESPFRCSCGPPFMHSPNLRCSLLTASAIVHRRLGTELGSVLTRRRHPRPCRTQLDAVPERPARDEVVLLPGSRSAVSAAPSSVPCPRRSSRPAICGQIAAARRIRRRSWHPCLPGGDHG